MDVEVCEPNTMVTPEKGATALLRAIEKNIDRDTYRGEMCNACLIGVVMAACGINGINAANADDSLYDLAALFEVNYHEVAAVWHLAATPRYKNDFPAAFAMAQTILLGQIT